MVHKLKASSTFGIAYAEADADWWETKLDFDHLPAITTLAVTDLISVSNGSGVHSKITKANFQTEILKTAAGGALDIILGGILGIKDIDATNALRASIDSSNGNGWFQGNLSLGSNGLADKSITIYSGTTGKSGFFGFDSGILYLTTTNAEIKIGCNNTADISMYVLSTSVFRWKQSTTDKMTFTPDTGMLNLISGGLQLNGTERITNAGVASFTSCALSVCLKLTPTADPPATPSEGWIYADTDHHLYYYNGSAWLQLDNP